MVCDHDQFAPNPPGSIHMMISRYLYFRLHRTHRILDQFPAAMYPLIAQPSVRNLDIFSSNTFLLEHSQKPHSYFLYVRKLMPAYDNGKTQQAGLARGRARPNLGSAYLTWPIQVVMSGKGLPLVAP